MLVASVGTVGTSVPMLGASDRTVGASVRALAMSVGIFGASVGALAAAVVPLKIREQPTGPPTKPTANLAAPPARCDTDVRHTTSPSSYDSCSPVKAREQTGCLLYPDLARRLPKTPKLPFGRLGGSPRRESIWAGISRRRRIA